jgi:hypothetical protein
MTHQLRFDAKRTAFIGKDLLPPAQTNRGRAAHGDGRQSDSFLRGLNADRAHADSNSSRDENSRAPGSAAAGSAKNFSIAVGSSHQSKKRSS